MLILLISNACVYVVRDAQVDHFYGETTIQNKSSLNHKYGKEI